MAGEDHLYHAADGTTSPLNTADALDAAVSDMSQRLLALETKPAPTLSGDNPATDSRVGRLETVLGEFFYSQFQRYDADHKPADKPADGTEAGAASATAGQ